MFGGLVFSGLIGATIGHFLRFKYGLEFDLISITFGVATITGFTLGLKSLTEVLVGPFGGYFSDIYGRYKSLVISAALTSISLLLLGVHSTPLVTLFVLLLVFIAGVMLMMQLLSLLGMIVDDESRSQVFSVFNTFQDFGSALGPLIGLSLISANLLPTLYSISGVLLFILIVFACLLLSKDMVTNDPC